jgi:hypothetical protein
MGSWLRGTCFLLRHQRRSIVVSACAALLGVAPMRAQQLELRVGDRVRIITSPLPDAPSFRVGIFRGMHGDSLAVQFKPTVIDTIVLRSDIEVQKSVGPGNYAIEFAAIGATFGGGGTYYALGPHHSNLATEAGGLLAGGVIGALLGSRFHSDRWRVVHPGLRVRGTFGQISASWTIPLSWGRSGAVAATGAQ